MVKPRQPTTGRHVQAGGSPPVRVFLSSTAKDLWSHRETVAQAIEQLGEYPTRMETFGAQPGAPLEVCRRLAAEADALVLFVGNRYGWVPTPEEGGDGETSVTWWEVKATLEADKPVFAFLLDPEIPRDDDEDEGSEARAGLDRFRAFLDRRTMRQTFTSPDNLAWKVTTSLGKWLLGEAGTAAISARGGVTAVPKLPTHYVPRPEYLEPLRQMLLEGTSRTPRVTAPGKVMGPLGFQGMGGIGKTVLAAAAAADPEVEAAFPDGVYWVTIGQHPNVLQIQQELAALAGNADAVFHSEGHGKAVLKNWLDEKAVLLVLDDVWELGHVSILDIVGARGRVLVTTRNQEVLVGLGADVLQVETLEPPQARALLAHWAGRPEKELPAIADQVANACGYLPLALAMIGAMVQVEPTAWRDALHRLQNAELDKIRQDLRDYLHPDLLRALDVSVAALDPADRESYVELAVLPKGVAVPEAAVEVLWSLRGFDIYETRAVLRRLVARSLGRRDESGVFSLHDLQADYLKSQVDDIPALHGRLLDAYAARCPEGFASGPDDGYYFQRLPYHMAGAGRRDQLRHLLLSLAWLEAKLAVTDIHALLADFDLVGDDQTVREVREALELARHILAKDRSQIAGQLIGRLRSGSRTDFTSVLAQAARPKRRPWFRPLAPSLTPPGGPLVRVLAGHSAPVRALAVIDENRIVSASDDSTLISWDLRSGEPLKIFRGHSDWTRAVTVLGKDQIISGSDDGTIRLWEVETGTLIAVLSGHTKQVRAMTLVGSSILVSAGDRDHGLRVWDLREGRLLRRLLGHDRAITALATISPRLVGSTSYDWTVRLWDLHDEEPPIILRGHRGAVTTLLAMDQRTLITGSFDRTIRVWDLNNQGKQKGEPLTGHTNWIRDLAALNSNKIASASGDGTVRIWDLKSRDHIELPRSHHGEVAAVAAPGESTLVSGASDSTVCLWRLVPGLSTPPMTSSNGRRVSDILPLPDGTAVSASIDGRLHAWNLSTGQGSPIVGATRSFSAICRLSNGTVLVAAANGALQRLEVEDRRLSECFIGSVDLRPVATMAPLFGQHFVTGGTDGCLRVWSFDRRELVVVLRGHQGGINRVVTLENGLVLSGSDDRSLILWDVKHRAILRKLRGHLDAVQCLIPLTNRIVASGSDDGTIAIWDLYSENGLLRRFAVHRRPVTDIVAVDENRLVSVSEDRTVKLLDLREAGPLATFTLDAPLTALCFDSSTRTLCVGDVIGAIHCLRLEEATEPP